MSPATTRRAVTFDLWHTLVYLAPEDEEAYMASQMDAAADVLVRSPVEPGGPERSRSQLRSLFEVEYDAAVKTSQEGRTVTPAEQLRRAAVQGGRVPRPEAYVEKLAGLVGRTRFVLGPEAIETVRSLREDGFRTAVISNTVGEPGATLRPTLRSLGLDDWVEEYLFSDEHPWTKPSPEIFQEALRRLGVSPDRAVHVGDGWVDVEGSERAGMKAGVLYTGLQRYGARYQALFLPPGWTRPATPYRIERLGELVPLARRLLPADGGT